MADHPRSTSAIRLMVSLTFVGCSAATCFGCGSDGDPFAKPPSGDGGVTHDASDGAQDGLEPGDGAGGSDGANPFNPVHCVAVDEAACEGADHELPIPTHWSAAAGGVVFGASDVPPGFVSDPMGSSEYVAGNCYFAYPKDFLPGLDEYWGDEFSTHGPGDTEAREWAHSACVESGVLVRHLLPPREDGSQALGAGPDSDQCNVQVVHAAQAAGSLYTVFLPPSWSADAPPGTYPIVANGFYDLHSNTFRAFTNGSLLARTVGSSGLDGRRGVIGVLWNGGGADGSRTVNPRAFDQFAEVVEQVVERYSGNRDWIVMFGISRGAATALGMASNPYANDYRVVLSVAEAAPTRYGTHASLVGPTYPGLLKAAGWHTGLADSWRSGWIYPSCGRPELAGKDGVPAALQISTGSSDPGYVDESLSLASDSFLAGLAQAGTQVQLVVTGNDDICPTHLQSQYARALMDRGIPVDLRLAVRMGHTRLVLPGHSVALSDETVTEAVDTVSDPSLDLDGPVPQFFVPRVSLYRVDRATEEMEEFVPSDGLGPFTIDFPWLVAWGQRIPVAATGEPGTEWRLSLDGTNETLEGSVGMDGTETVWLDVPDSMPAGVYGCSLEIRKPGQASFSVIPATATPTGEACTFTVEESEPDVDYVEAYKRAKSPALSKFGNTCWGLSEY